MTPERDRPDLDTVRETLKEEKREIEESAPEEPDDDHDSGDDES
jgi:hypothetical protein